MPCGQLVLALRLNEYNLWHGNNLIERHSPDKEIGSKHSRSKIRQQPFKHWETVLWAGGMSLLIVHLPLTALNMWL